MGDILETGVSLVDLLRTGGLRLRLRLALILRFRERCRRDFRRERSRLCRLFFSLRCLSNQLTPSLIDSYDLFHIGILQIIHIKLLWGKTSIKYGLTMVFH